VQTISPQAAIRIILFIVFDIISLFVLLLSSV